MKALGIALRGLAREAKELARSKSARSVLAEESALALRGARSLAIPTQRTAAGETLAHAVLRKARRNPNQNAVVLPEEARTYAELADGMRRAARALQKRGMEAQDTIAILGENSVAYLEWVLGAAYLGIPVALLNSKIQGRALAHAISRVAPSLLISAQPHEAVPHLSFDAHEAIAPHRGSPRRCLATRDFVYIYTSGTTGLPKACPIPHGKAVLAGAGFGGAVLELQEGEALYAPLPLYHASAMLLGFSSAIMRGGTFVTRPKFSASAYFEDVRRHDVRALLYIGELIRFVLSTPPSEQDRNHRVRIAAGNGLRAPVWRAFEDRFGISNIREFYAATEAPGAILNVSRKVGSVGHMPARHTGWMVLAKRGENGELSRDRHGLVVPSDAGEPGELLIRIAPQGTPLVSFQGYLDRSASQAKLCSDVLAKGDQFFRSGDLLRIDDEGFAYFVDRLGDTFRWRGENVSSAEVEDAIAERPDIRAAWVVGVEVPGEEGRAGMAILWPKADTEIDLEGLLAHLRASLMPAALPLLVELREAAEAPEVTATMKFRKQAFVPTYAPAKNRFLLTEDGYRAFERN